MTTNATTSSFSDYPKTLVLKEDMIVFEFYDDAVNYIFGSAVVTISKSNHKEQMNKFMDAIDECSTVVPAGTVFTFDEYYGLYEANVVTEEGDTMFLGYNVLKDHI
jgi:hypothetical protein